MENVIYWVIMAAITLETLAILFFDRLDWGWAKANRDKVPANLADTVTPEDHAKSADYSLEHQRLGIVRTAVDWVVTVLILSCGLLPWIYGLALDNWGAFNYWGQAFALSLIGIVIGMLFWPFSWISTFKIEQKYGFNRSTPTIWINDKFKAIVIGMVLGIPITAAVLWMAGSFVYWWVYAFVLVSAYSFFVSWVYPNWISPLFNKFEQLPEGGLRDRLNALAQKAGMKFEKIFVMDASRRSAHANAYFTGFGSSRRVVLYDTLINQLDEEEVAAVLAHEIGHLKKKHVLQHKLASLVLQLVSFYVLSVLMGWSAFLEAFGFSKGMGLGAVLLLMSFVSSSFTYWLTPLFSSWSRKHEYEADAIATELIGTPMPLVTGLRKITTKSLHSVEEHPVTRAFYASHPSLKQREDALGVELPVAPQADS